MKITVPKQTLYQACLNYVDIDISNPVISGVGSQHFGLNFPVDSTLFLVVGPTRY